MYFVRSLVLSQHQRLVAACIPSGSLSLPEVPLSEYPPSGTSLRYRPRWPAARLMAVEGYQFSLITANLILVLFRLPYYRIISLYQKNEEHYKGRQVA